MTDQPTPETDAKLDSGPLGPGDWLAYARALEIQRNEARAERDALRAVLQRIVWNGGSATNAMLFDARTALAQ